MKPIWLLLFLFCFERAMKQDNSRSYSDSLARVDILSSFSVEMNTLLNLNQQEKDQSLDKILTLSDLYWSTHYSHPWLEKRGRIAVAIYAGANPNLPNSKYYNHPLIDAARAGDFHLVQFLCNHGAQPALTDPTLGFSRLLRCTKKARMARYLLEKGAQIKSDIYLLDHVFSVDYSPKLLALYLSLNVSFDSLARLEGSALHSLARHAKDYDEGDPQLFKKCNILLTHLPDEVVLRLLKSGYRKPNSHEWVPFETPEEFSSRLHTDLVMLGYQRGNPNAQKLSVIFKHQREALEEKIKAR